MKKVIFAFIFFGFAIGGMAQRKNVILAEFELGTVFCKYMNIVDLDKGDTTTILHISFRNAEYSHIVDVKSVYFNTTKDSTDVFDFVKDLKAASLEMGNKTTITWDREKYTLALYDFNSGMMYLYEAKGKGHAVLNKKQVEKLINWIESIGFKK